MLSGRLSQVAEAAVVAIPHKKWDERPLLIVVAKLKGSLSRDDMLHHLQVTPECVCSSICHSSDLADLLADALLSNVGNFWCSPAYRELPPCTKRPACWLAIHEKPIHAIAGNIFVMSMSLGQQRQHAIGIGALACVEHCNIMFWCCAGQNSSLVDA